LLRRKNECYFFDNSDTQIEGMKIKTAAFAKAAVFILFNFSIFFVEKLEKKKKIRFLTKKMQKI
jgi:hypothetical protein